MLYHLYVNIQMFIFVYIYIASWICKQIGLFTMHKLCQSIVDNAQVIYAFDIYIYIYTYTGPNVYVKIALLKQLRPLYLCI